MSIIEYEYRFINYNKHKIIKKLKELGAYQVHEPMLYPLCTFKLPNNEDKKKYLRVRKEYDSIKIAYKEHGKDDFPLELEVKVDNFNNTINLFKKLGYEINYCIEKIREKWSMEHCKEIIFDSYPGGIEWMEVECDTKEYLEEITKKLGLKREKNFNLEDVLLNYFGIIQPSDFKAGLSIKTAKSILSPYIKKNIDLFNQNIDNQNKLLESIEKNKINKEVYENFEKESFEIKNKLINLYMSKSKKYVKKQSIKKQSIKKQSIKKQSIKKQSIKKQSIKKQSIKK
jgi:adenylate cyclase class IV